MTDSTPQHFSPINNNWYLIKDKLPLFIKENHKTFTRFIEAYYEWLEKSNNPLYCSFNTEYFSDVDTTPNIFLNKFRTQYLNDFPINILSLGNGVNLKTIIKNIKQFYSSKGSEKSFKFLFRLLYDAYVEIYYPRNDLLVASGNSWIERKTLRVRGLSWENAEYAKNSLIYHKNTITNNISSARIIEIKCNRIDEEDIFELELDNISGNFSTFSSTENLTQFLAGIVGEEATIDLVKNGEIIPLKVYLVNGIQSVTIDTYGLVPGQFITIEPNDNSTSTGKHFSAIVNSVDDTGKTTEILIFNHGYDYRGDPSTFSIYKKESETIKVLLQGTITIQKSIKENGFYDTTKSSPSSGGIIRDNRKYQESSYVLKSELSPEIYIDAVKKLIHPAGVGIFSEILIKDNLNMKVNNVTEITQFVNPLVGNFLPYTFNTIKNLRNDSFPNADPDLYPVGFSDLYPNGFDPGIDLPDENDAEIQHLPRPFEQLKTNVDRVRYSYIPANIDDIDNLNRYWVVYPNPNKNFNLLKNSPLKNLTIDNFLNFRGI